MSLHEWNERYRSGEALSATPAQLLVDAASPLMPGRALDLACGPGRNAIWLAGRGWEVVALDGAEEAIRRVPSPIDARVFDLEAGDPLPFEAEAFDLVAILFYLHRPLFAEVRRVLRPGGTFVTAARTKGRFAVRPGELHEIFDDYEIVHDCDGEIAELVARRPL